MVSISHKIKLKRNQPSNPDSTSTFANHLYSLDHSPSPNNPTPIHFETKGLRLDLLESTEIKQALLNDENIINSQLDIKKNTIIDTRRNKEVVLCLVQIDIHTYISAIYVYIYYLFV